MHFKLYFPRIQDKYKHKIAVRIFCFRCQKFCVNAKRTVMIYRREILTNPIQQNSSCEAGCHSVSQEAFVFCRTRKYIYVFATDCLSCLFRASSVQSTHAYCFPKPSCNITSLTQFQKLLLYFRIFKQIPLPNRIWSILAESNGLIKTVSKARRLGHQVS